jgi:hypothetical protein
MIGGANRRKTPFGSGVLWLVVVTLVFWAIVAFLIAKFI